MRSYALPEATSDHREMTLGCNLLHVVHRKINRQLRVIILNLGHCTKLFMNEHHKDAHFMPISVSSLCLLTLQNSNATASISFLAYPIFRALFCVLYIKTASCLARAFFRTIKNALPSLYMPRQNRGIIQEVRVYEVIAAGIILISAKLSLLNHLGRKEIHQTPIFSINDDL
jgi:hypothetical protein